MTEDEKYLDWLTNREPSIMSDSRELEGFADYLQLCELCGDWFDFQQVSLDELGKRFYCHKCSS